MPTYQYRCDACSVDFERFQHFADEPLRTCPRCEGSVHRVIHPVGVIFKGSGFYVTDNKRSGGLTSKVEPKEAKAEAPAPEAKPSSSPD